MSHSTERRLALSKVGVVRGRRVQGWDAGLSLMMTWMFILPALLATTTTVGAFPRWPAAMMTTWGKAELMNTLSKLGRTHVLSIE